MAKVSYTFYGFNQNSFKYVFKYFEKLLLIERQFQLLLMHDFFIILSVHQEIICTYCKYTNKRAILSKGSYKETTNSC